MEWQKPLPQLKVDIPPIPVPPPLVPPPVPQPLPPDPRIPVIPDIHACVGDFYEVDIGNAGGSITDGTLPAGLNIVGEKLTGIFSAVYCDTFTIDRAGYTQVVEVRIMNAGKFTPTVSSQSPTTMSIAVNEGHYMDVCKTVLLSVGFTRVIPHRTYTLPGVDSTGVALNPIKGAYYDQRYYYLMSDGTVRSYRLPSSGNVMIEDTASRLNLQGLTGSGSKIDWNGMAINNGELYLLQHDAGAGTIKIISYNLTSKALNTGEITLSFTFPTENRNNWFQGLAVTSNRIFVNEGVQQHVPALRENYAGYNIDYKLRSFDKATLSALTNEDIQHEDAWTDMAANATHLYFNGIGNSIEEAPIASNVPTLTSKRAFKGYPFTRSGAGIGIEEDGAIDIFGNTLKVGPFLTRIPAAEVTTHFNDQSTLDYDTFLLDIPVGTTLDEVTGANLVGFVTEFESAGDQEHVVDVATAKSGLITKIGNQIQITIPAVPEREFSFQGSIIYNYTA